MTEILHRIQLSPESYRTLETLRSSGFKTSYTRELARMERLIADLSLSARDAYRSKVPIDTGQLRNDGLEIVTGSNRLSAEIVVLDYRYTNSRGKAVTAAKLAIDLDSGDFSGLKRTKNSFALNGYSSISAGEGVGGWISSARGAFNAVRKRIISNG